MNAHRYSGGPSRSRLVKRCLWCIVVLGLAFSAPWWMQILPDTQNYQPPGDEHRYQQAVTTPTSPDLRSSPPVAGSQVVSEAAALRLIALEDPTPTPTPSEAPTLEQPDDEGPSLPLGFEDLFPFITDWIAGKLAEALHSMAGAISHATLSLRIESLAIMDPADPSGFHDLSFGLARGLVLLLITWAGIVIMAGENIQARYTVKEFAPRLVFAYVAAEMSLQILELVVTNTNTVIDAILTSGFAGVSIDEITGTVTEAADTLSTDRGDQWTMLALVLGLLVMLTLLLIGVVSRSLLLMLLAISGPVALACHALPATEVIAKTWWRALGACVASAVGQAVVLVLWMNLFFDGQDRTTNPLAMPDAVAAYADMLLIMALLWIMHKVLSIPLKKAFTTVGGSPIAGIVRFVVLARYLGAKGLAANRVPVGAATRAGAGSGGGTGIPLKRPSIPKNIENVAPTASAPVGTPVASNKYPAEPPAKRPTEKTPVKLPSRPVGPRRFTGSTGYTMPSYYRPDDRILEPSNPNLRRQRPHFLDVPPDVRRRPAALRSKPTRKPGASR